MKTKTGETKLKSKTKQFFLIFFETLGLSLCMLLSVFPLSCRVSVSGLEILGTNCQVPVLENYKIIDEQNISMTFSEEVNLLSSGITEYETENCSPLETDFTKSEDGKTIFLKIPSGTQVGKKYLFLGEVENKWGSSLTFSYKFSGYNGRVPKLILTEIMDETRKITRNKIDQKIYEFIEFYALTDGKLSGLKIFSCNDGESKSFFFPDLEVKAGDFITIHYRKNSHQNEMCFSETSDKTSCKADGASDKSWDIYIDNTESRFGASQDIIYLENTNDGKIYQAIMYSKNGKIEWGKEILKETHKRCIEDGVWTGNGTLEDTITFEAYPNFVRNNLSEIIRMNSAGTLPWPLPSDKNQWDYFKTSAFTPGYCDIF